MPTRHKELMKLIGYRVHHRQSPCQPAFFLLEPEGSPIGYGKQGISQHMTTLFYSSIQPLEIRQAIGRLSGEHKDDKHHED